MIPLQENIFSVKVLENSIRYDGQVRRWFVSLINSPAAGLILEGDLRMVAYRRKLRWACCVYDIMLVFLLVSSFLLVLNRNYFWLIPIILLCLGAICVFYSLRDEIVILSLKIVEKDPPAGGLNNVTLYQLGEYYALKYTIPSLIDVVFAQDTLQKKCVLLMLLFLILDKEHNLIIFLAIMMTAFLLSNFSLIYRNLDRVLD